MQRAYNVWHLSNCCWTDFNATYFQNEGFHYNNPKRLSLEEARKLLDHIIAKGRKKEHYVIFEIDANNKPIMPKCRQRQ